MGKDKEESDGEISDGEGANCPICLLPFTNQDIGTPESCDHEFCLRCILEWSKNVNTCPYDRRVFHLIFARHTSGGAIYDKIKVTDCQLLAKQEEGEDDPTACEVCGQADREDRMLLCDDCDSGYHMDCLIPALTTVPDDDWYCPECLPARQEQPSTSAAGTRAAGTRGGHAVSIPRTDANRRVFRRIFDRIFSSSEEDEEETDVEGSESSGEESVGGQEVTHESAELEEDWSDDESIRYTLPGLLIQPATSQAPPVKRKATTTRRKSTKRRKTTKRRSTKKSSSSKTRKTKRRRSKRWLSTRQKRSAGPRSAKQRIASRLGLVAPPTGSSIPLVKKKKPETTEEGLSVFGDTEGARHIGSSSSISPVRQAKPSHIVKVPINTRPIKRPPSKLSEGHLSATTDLLGSILDGQSLLTTNSRDIQISKEGRLSLKVQHPCTGSSPSNKTSASSSSCPNYMRSKPSPVKHTSETSRLNPGSESGRDRNTTRHEKRDNSGGSDSDTTTCNTTLHSSADYNDSGIDSMTNNSPEVIKHNKDNIVTCDDAAAKMSSASNITSLQMPAKPRIKINITGTNSKKQSDMDKTTSPAPPAIRSPKHKHITISDSSSGILGEVKNTRPENSPLVTSKALVRAIEDNSDLYRPTLSKSVSSSLGESIPFLDSVEPEKTVAASVLRQLDIVEIRPEIPVITAYPIAIKKEDRKVYDSRDKDNIIKGWRKEKNTTADNNDGEKALSTDGEINDDDDGEVIVLTPPPRSPESVVVLSSDSEDERKNKLRKNQSNRKTPAARNSRTYRVHDSDSESKSRSRSNSRTRKRSDRDRRQQRDRSRRSRSRNRRNSPQRRQRRSRSNSRLRNKRRSRSRSIRRKSRSPRRRRSRSPMRRVRSPVRNPVRNSRPSNSPVRRVTAVPRRRTPVKERLGPVRRTSRDRRRDSRSPIRSKNRPSTSPVRRQNGNRSRSPQHRSTKRRSRTPSLTSSISRVRRSASRGSHSRQTDRQTNGHISSNTDSHSPSHRQAKVPSSHTLAAELERNYKRKLTEGLTPYRSPSAPPGGGDEPVVAKSKSKKKGKSSAVSSKKKKRKRAKTDDSVSKTKKKKKSSKKKSGKSSSKSADNVPSDEETSSIAPRDEQQAQESDGRSQSSSSRAISRQESRAAHNDSDRSGSEVSASPHRNDGDRTPQEMVIDMQSDSERLSPAKPAMSPVRAPPVKSSPVRRAPAHGDSSEKRDRERKHREEENVQLDKLQNIAENLVKQKGDSPYSPSKDFSTSDDEGEETNQELERKAEEQALQVIALLKNEVAEPDVIPPAQPPKSVSQKPLVIDWLVQRLDQSNNSSPHRGATPSRREDTPPTVTGSQSASTAVEDTDLPASATELSNKQLLERMVGQERIADEIKIVLKPYYQKAQINKDEYKLIMKNCVTKIYTRSQGKINPAKVKEFVEKYAASMITRRKKK